MACSVQLVWWYYESFRRAFMYYDDNFGPNHPCLYVITRPESTPSQTVHVPEYIGSAEKGLKQRYGMAENALWAIGLGGPARLFVAPVPHSLRSLEKKLIWENQHTVSNTQHRRIRPEGIDWLEIVHSPKWESDPIPKFA